MTRILKSLAIAAILTAPLDANAQQNCAPRDVVLQHLSERFGESRQAIGMGPDGRVVEVFAALDNHHHAPKRADLPCRLG